ncbi:hypothetical protein KGQ20_24215 [Catenulispora sp. NF23]|uniref:hypothetical protein n=1 Tax=Catenulispora pinistramenti TaxID=2705254 RepID=UPI001BAC6C79|nr:hypothetical protein [Catenulispora pinistramenti]MBS2535872.1 hypothetical protein [Catenulispora pinistramenti]
MHIRRPHIWAVAAITGAVAAGVVATMASAAPGKPAASAVSYLIPTVSTAATNLADGLSLAVNVGGGPTRDVEVDTGSLGFVIARGALGPGAVDTGKAGFIEYTSSGKILSGEYFLAAVSFQRPQGAVATVPIRVLGVTASSCASGYPGCTPDSDISKVGMLGVGYSEYAKTDSPGPTSADNAFLQLAAMHNGQAQPGYIVTRGGVTLGLTAQQIASFHTVHLASAPPPSGTGSDIESMPGCFAFPDHGDASHCGSILFDTGISKMIVGLPTADRPAPIATAIPDGTRIKVGTPNLTGPAFGYTTTVGDPGDPIAPLGNPAASWAHDTAFVNTGRELLAAYDYLYDAVGRQSGFRSDPN